MEFRQLPKCGYKDRYIFYATIHFSINQFLTVIYSMFQKSFECVSKFLIIKILKFTSELILWLQYTLEIKIYSKLILKRLMKIRYFKFLDSSIIRR